MASPPYKWLALQLLKSNPAREPLPVFGNGEPVTTVREPSALMVNMETPLESANARNWPFTEIFMLSRGVQHVAVVNRGAAVSAPVAVMPNVMICPLLEAIRKLPSGVAATDMPWQLSKVSPVANGDPATSVNAPFAGLMVKELIVMLPVLATKRRLLCSRRVLRRCRRGVAVH